MQRKYKDIKLFLFLYFTNPNETKCFQLSDAQKRNLSKEREEKNLDLMSETAKLTDFYLQVKIYKSKYRSKPEKSSEIIRSEHKYRFDHFKSVGMIKMSQTGSFKIYLTTDFTLPINFLDTTTENDSNYFTKQSKFETAKNESSMDDHNGRGMIYFAKNVSL